MGYSRRKRQAAEFANFGFIPEIGNGLHRSRDTQVQWSNRRRRICREDTPERLRPIELANANRINRITDDPRRCRPRQIVLE